MKSSRPPSWRAMIEPRLRRLGAALRGLFNPTANRPAAAIAALVEQRMLGHFRENVPRVVAVYRRAAAAANAPASSDRVLVVLADVIERYVVLNAPGRAEDQQHLAARLRRELPGMVAAAWQAGDAQERPAQPAPVRAAAAAQAISQCVTAHDPVWTPQGHQPCDEARADLGAALVEHLNANVQRRHREDAVTAARSDAAFQRFLDRVVTPDGGAGQLELPI